MRAAAVFEGHAKAENRTGPFVCISIATLWHHPLPSRPPSPQKVSAIVRGRPSEALRALMDPASPTTILGPAREVEVMDSAPGKQVGSLQ